MKFGFEVVLVLWLSAPGSRGQTGSSIPSQTTEDKHTGIKNIQILTPESAIDRKVRELQPYLEDGMETNKTQNDTNIINIKPTHRSLNIRNLTKYNVRSESVSDSISRYNRLRDEAEIKLEKDAISRKTIKLVTETLDDMLSTLAKVQCPSVLLQEAVPRQSEALDALQEDIRFDNNSNCFIGSAQIDPKVCTTMKYPFTRCKIYGTVISMEKCKEILDNATKHNVCLVNDIEKDMSVCNAVQKAIKKQIDGSLDALFASEGYGSLIDLNGQFTKFTRRPRPVDATASLRQINVLDLYNTLRMMATDIVRDTHYIPDRYSLRCTIIDMEKDTRRSQTQDPDPCPHFRVCSLELKNFLTFFYKSLNDTVVRTFRNYTLIYEQRVGTDLGTLEAVKILVKGTHDNLERRIADEFINTTSTIILHRDKDSETKMAAVKKYVKDTVKNVKKTINTFMVQEFNVIRINLQHKLAPDLTEFEEDIVSRICSFFATCRMQLLT